MAPRHHVTILLGATLAAACSSSQPANSADRGDSAPEEASAGDLDATAGAANDAEATVADSGGCLVVASNYDKTCTTDSDCTAVPPGGDTCHPCSIPSGYSQCPLAAVSVTVAAGYLSDLTAAFTRVQDPTERACITQACPTSPRPVCANGLCTTTFLLASVDAALE